MPSIRPTLRHMTWFLFGLVTIFVVVWQAPALHFVQGLASYLPLHMFTETFSIIVSMMVFGVAWNTYSQERPGNIIILSCALLAVGLIDFAHMLSFKGMPDFVTPSDPEKAINLWLSARVVTALALLTVALRPWRPLSDQRTRYWLLAGSLAVSSVVIWYGTVYPQAWPRTFIAGHGLTPFKIGAEWTVITIMLVPAVLFYLQAKRPQPYDAASLFTATVVSILGELSFTLYSDVADIFNLLGHLYKVIAYAFIYRAVFVNSVREPFQRLDAEYAENQRIAKELRAASLYTRSLIEASLDPLVTISAEGKITDVNQATEKATGKERSDLIGTDFSDYFTEPERARRGYQHVFLKGSVTDYPLAIRHRDGHVTDVLYNASVYRNEAGEVLGVFAAARDNTERKQAEAVRTQLAAIVESSNDAIIGKNPDGIITSWNKSAEEIYGYAADEIIGQHVTVLAPPSRHAEIFEFLDRIRKGGTVVNHETERIRKNGDLIHVALTLSPIKDASGNITGISTIARDITERKKAEEKIRESEKKFRSMTDTSPLAIYMSSGVEQKAEYINPRFTQLFGYKLEEVPSVAEWWPLAYPDETYRKHVSEEWQRKVDQAIRTNSEIEPMEVVVACKDGSQKNILWGYVSTGVQNWAFGLDLTERKRAEEKLRAVSIYTRSLIEASMDPLVTISAEGKITDVNSATEKATGMNRVDLIGTDFSNYFTEPDKAREGYQQAFAKGSVADYPLALRHRDGHVTDVLYNANVYRDEAGKVLGVFAAARDVTERRRAEEEVNALNRELEQRVAVRTSELEAANKELEAFSYSVSHDLRSPLRAIDGFSHILLEDYAVKLDEEGKRLLNVVRENTVKMGRLIDDILKFSRAGRLEMTFSGVDMEALVREVCEELRPTTEHELHIEIEPIPSTKGDRAMIRQVFVNLLSNAIKFTRTKEPARIKVGAFVQGNETVYFVQDNGAGFDMRYIDRLFGVFQRLHAESEFEGTGIGLAIVKRIVVRHGGRVWAEGKVNEGATIYFALPTKGSSGSPASGRSLDRSRVGLYARSAEESEGKN